MSVRKSCHFSINHSNLWTNVISQAKNWEELLQHVVRVHEILAHFICSCNLPLHKPLNPAKVGNKNSLHIVTLPLVSPRNAVWGTREENSISMTRHHPDLSSASYRLKLSTNEKHYPDLGSDASSVWNFCSCSSDVISRGNKTIKWWCHENSKTRLIAAVFPDPTGRPRVSEDGNKTKKN